MLLYLVKIKASKEIIIGIIAKMVHKNKNNRVKSLTFCKSSH